MAGRTGARQQRAPVQISMLTIPTCGQRPWRLANQTLPPSIAGQATSVLPPPRPCLRKVDLGITPSM
jgi:hypothetical protein